jgi:hypothetical protein
MNAMKTGLLCLTSVVVAAVGCSKQPPPPPEQPKTFDITETRTVVAEDSIPQAPASRIVRADFNMDNLEDIALAEDAGERSMITIYLRKPGSDLEAQYFKAGGIDQTGPYSVSALMSRKLTEHTDLIAIFNYPDGRKQMVHYRSDGRQFQEILREDIGSRTDTGPPP